LQERPVDQLEIDWTQDEHLERVSSRIARAIIEFCRKHKQFHADQLRAHVIRENRRCGTGQR
jgi:hypothetical protein